MFQWGIKTVIVDYQTFYKYIKMAVKEFSTRYPDKKEMASNILLKIKEKYKCSDKYSKDIILRKLTFDS